MNVALVASVLFQSGFLGTLVTFLAVGEPPLVAR